MTVAEAEQYGTRELQAAGIESARLDTFLLLENTTGNSRAWLMAHPETELTQEDADRFTAAVGRRSQRIPLVHLTNEREFYGLTMFIDERVLTPRVETEKMVDYAIKYAPQGSRLIDIGTGSGAIAIAIKTRRPDLEVYGTDVSPEALEVAAINAKRHNVDISLSIANLFDGAAGRFAAVVTNLPYLRNDADLMPEVQREPTVALFGGADGLDLYRAFLQQLPDHLNPEGYLFTECDPWQHAGLIAEAAAVGLTPIEQNDYFILGFQRRD